MRGNKVLLKSFFSLLFKVFVMQKADDHWLFDVRESHFVDGVH